jgi:hypothetical protein
MPTVHFASFADDERFKMKNAANHHTHELHAVSSRGANKTTVFPAVQRFKIL